MLRCFGKNTPVFPGRRPVATLGMFDGVHRGHQAILRATVDKARALGVPSLAFTFDIHPRAVVAPETAPAMITSLEHRLLLLEQFGLDGVCVLAFTPELARVEAEAFAETFVFQCQAVQALVLGPRAHWGRGGAGNLAMMQSLAARHGVSLDVVPPVTQAEIPISSTAIRKAVAAADLERAAAMLGRPVSVLGTVVRGQGVGRELGFPTLNLDPHHELHPPRGVYRTRVRCGDTIWPSVTNIGHRPTVDATSPGDVLIEAHVLQPVGDLYGQAVEVRFLERLRDEAHFPSRMALIEQIQRDVEDAKAAFAAE